jgi:formate hydrogenlyase subunit 6/NADH:ubiquinone oxidoreductase subunit I
LNKALFKILSTIAIPIKSYEIIEKEELTMSDNKSKQWMVELDQEKCSMCEVCAKKCPTGALRLDRTENTLSIYFNSNTCIGCIDEKGCQALCPEDAIQLEELIASGDKEAEVLLIKSKLVQCSYCKEYFAPETKIGVIKKKKLKHDVVEDYCPLCRRTNMVVNFIDEKRDPKGHAEYRSANDMLRRYFRKKEEMEGGSK